MRPSEFQQLKYEVVDDVATITFNRPERLNSFTSRLYEEIRWAMRASQFDDNVDFVVLTGAGRAFATGGDLNDVQAVIDEHGLVNGSYKYFDVLSFGDVFANPKITIAAINGWAVAGGLLMANACDVSIAAESACMAYPEAIHGMASRWEPALNLHNVNLSRLKYLLLTGRQITAKEAEALGLVTECVPDDQLMSRVEEVLTELRRTSRVSRRLYKEFLNSFVPIPTAAQSGNAGMESPEFTAGLAEFVHRERLT